MGIKKGLMAMVAKQALEKAKTAAEHAEYMRGKRRMDEDDVEAMGLKKGGSVKKGAGDKEGKLMRMEGRGMAKADMQKKGMKGYKEGGIATSLKAHAAAPASKAHGMKKGGSVMASKMGAVKTSPKPDGVAMKGKTKGKMVKMAGGGKC